MDAKQRLLDYATMAVMAAMFCIMAVYLLTFKIYEGIAAIQVD